MRFVLSSKASFTWSKCFQYLHRLGKDVELSIEHTSIKLATVNITHSAYVLFCFSLQFFEHFEWNSTPRQSFTAIMPVYFFLRSLRNLRNFQLDKAILTVNDTSLSLALHSRDHVRRTHTCNFYTGSSYHLKPLEWEDRNFFIVSPYQLKNILIRFRKTHFSRPLSLRIASTTSSTSTVQEMPIYCLGSEIIAFHYDKNLDGLMVQTYTESGSDESDASDLSNDVGEDELDSLNEPPTVTNKVKRSSNTITKALLPRSFFESLYIDECLRATSCSELISFDLEVLENLCEFCDSVASQICFTWCKAGSPLVVTFAENFAIGNACLMFPQESSVRTPFSSMEAIQEIEKDEKKLSLFHWSGVLWMNTCCNPLQIKNAALISFYVEVEPKSLNVRLRQESVQEHSSTSEAPQCVGSHATFSEMTHKSPFLMHLFHEDSELRLNSVNVMSSSKTGDKSDISDLPHSRKARSDFSAISAQYSNDAIRDILHDEPQNSSHVSNNFLPSTHPVTEHEFSDLIELDDEHKIPQICESSSNFLQPLTSKMEDGMKMQASCFSLNEASLTPLDKSYNTPRPILALRKNSSFPTQDPFLWNRLSFDSFADVLTNTDSSVPIHSDLSHQCDSQIASNASPEGSAHDAIHTLESLMGNETGQEENRDVPNKKRIRTQYTLEDYPLGSIYSAPSQFTNGQDWLDETGLW